MRIKLILFTNTCIRIACFLCTGRNAVPGTRQGGQEGAVVGVLAPNHHDAWACFALFPVKVTGVASIALGSTPSTQSIKSDVYIAGARTVSDEAVVAFSVTIALADANPARARLAFVTKVTVTALNARAVQVTFQTSARVSGPGGERIGALRRTLALQVTEGFSGICFCTGPMSTADGAGVDAIKAGAFTAVRPQVSGSSTVAGSVAIFGFGAAVFELTGSKEAVVVCFADLSIGDAAFGALSFAIVAAAVVFGVARLGRHRADVVLVDVLIMVVVVFADGKRVVCVACGAVLTAPSPRSWFALTA